MLTQTAEIRRDLVGDDLVVVMYSQHRMLELLLGRLSRMCHGPESEAHRLVGAVIAISVRGFVAEETYLHPLLLEFLDGGPQPVDRNLAEHDDAERVMEHLALMRPSDPGFWCDVDRLRAMLCAHLDGEDPHRLSQLRGRAVAPEVLRRLWADSVDASRNSIPAQGTHPNADLESAWFRIRDG